MHVFAYALLAASCGTAFAQSPAPASLRDHERFPTRAIAASTTPRALPVAEPGGVRLPREISVEGEAMGFDAAMQGSGTAAWIVLRDGRVVDERYYGGRDANAVFPVFSVTKSLVGTLAAIAREEGALGDIDAPIPELLPAAVAEDRRCARIAWRDLLDMKSGARFSEVYDDADSDVAKLYLADDLDAEAARTGCDARPGSRFRYASIDTQWLGTALAAKLGQPLDALLQQRIWTPIGAAHDATWSTDGAGRIKAFCCLNLRAMDLARFGQWMLERGAEARPSKAWVDGLLERARRGEPYADQWWLLHDAKSGPDATALLAEGILGQYLFIHPHARLVIVRIGEREGDIPWRTLFGAIAANNPPAP